MIPIEQHQRTVDLLEITQTWQRCTTSDMPRGGGGVQRVGYGQS